jgi:hypothetical protein
LERRREEVEFTQFRIMKQISFTAEVSEPSRGLGTDDGDPDEFNGCRKLFVAPIETSLLELFPDPSELGGEITEGVRRIDVFDDQIETVEGIKADFRQAENLDVGFIPSPVASWNLAVIASALFRPMTPFTWARISPRSLRPVRVR